MINLASIAINLLRISRKYAGAVQVGRAVHGNPPQFRGHRTAPSSEA